MSTDRPSSQAQGQRAAGLSRFAGRRRAQVARSRAADRHYLAVVAAEARRLAGQLRPATQSRPGRRAPVRPGASAEGLS